MSSAADIEVGPPHSRPEQAAAAAGGAGGQPWAKLAALALVTAALLPPINDLFRYGLLVVAAVLIAAGAVSVRAKPWLAAMAVVAIGLVGQIWLASPRIEEGHNAFLIDRAGGALEAALPREAFRLMAAEFDARYPPSRRCDPARFGCWRGQGFPDQPFAFSADGIYDRPAYSRRVSAIGFSDPVWLRLGFINDWRYNWFTGISDIERAMRERGLDLLHRWKLEMPWYVMYRFPAEFAGSNLCWRGEVLWEGTDGHFDAINHASMQCRTLAPQDVGRRIFGVAIKQEPPLAMRLVPSAGVRLRLLIKPALALAAWAAVLMLLVRIRPRATGLSFALLALALIIVFLNDASFIGGVRPFDGGDDGLVYDGLARSMLRQLVAGDITGALAGGENVFFFTPGMRYLRVAEHFIFGETYLGYLSLILLLPFAVFAAFRRFLPLRWAVASVLIFTAIPIGVVFGSSFVQYVKWAARGFADPAAYVFFLGALIMLLGRVGEGPRNLFGRAFAAGLLFALALFVRPNIAPAAGILLAGAGLAALWQGQYRRVAGLTSGFLPVLGMALHNWVYGGVLVLFTSTATMAVLMPPSVYWAALLELLHFDFAGADLVRAVERIGDWLAGPSESLVFVPLNAAATAVLVRVVLWRQADPWLRLLAGATLTQHGVAIFYVAASRYHYLTWLLTLLVVTAWLHGEGVDLLRRAIPALCERVTRHPRWGALARGLQRITRLLEAE